MKQSDLLTVLHIFSGDLWAGAEVMIFTLLNRLREDPGLKIIALSLNGGILADRLREAGIETHVIPEADHAFPAILLRALKLFRKRGIDIIQSHRYKENLLALLLAKSIGVKRLVTTLHGLSEPPLHRQDGENPVRLKTKIDYFILKRSFNHAVAVSHEMKRTLVQRHGFRSERVRVIHNGIDLPPAASAPSPSVGDDLHIGTVGRMVPVKDFDLFLDVAAEVMRENDRVRFSILGEGPLKGRLVEKAKDLKIGGRVEFLPSCPDPFSYYRSLDLYLNTSIHEGIPLSVLAAMACGKPVVAPNVGGFPEIVMDGRDGFLVGGREPKGFVSACLALTRKQRLRAVMGANAANKIRTAFSGARMADGYRELYQQRPGS
jgi:glycosyltransferase involved in cell wall biosynthesis